MPKWFAGGDPFRAFSGCRTQNWLNADGFAYLKFYFTGSISLPKINRNNYSAGGRPLGSVPVVIIVKLLH